MCWKFALSRRLGVASLLLVVFSASFSLDAQEASSRGRKYKAPPPTARVEVTVIRASNGKPVDTASVVFHPLSNGKDNGNMELKTNDEGKAIMELLPVGSNVRIQVIAPGFQTYGEDFKVDKDTLAIEIKLHRPTEQYSTYKHASDASKTDKSDAKPEAGSGESTAPDAGAKPDAKQPDGTDKPDAQKQDAPEQDAPKPAPPPVG